MKMKKLLEIMKTNQKYFELKNLKAKIRIEESQDQLKFKYKLPRLNSTLSDLNSNPIHFSSRKQKTRLNYLGSNSSYVTGVNFYSKEIKKTFRSKGIFCYP